MKGRLMPIYEYSCDECGEKFEVLVQTPDAAVSCPACSSGKVEKLFSTFSARVAFKMPSCEGSTSRCSESKCRSGRCPISQA